MFYGSQDDIGILKNVTSTKGTFDVIVDDGGHTMKQQITSLIYLLPKVQSGGIYVLEDLLTSYMGDFGGAYLRNTTTIQFIKRLFDDIQGSSPQKTTTLGNKIRSFEIADEICFFTVK
ncbi:unnamed protein product [Adineta steineri]|uniref:Uncharacterized protein n=1 Tax=Adineta steineri TaxID=433720 RepID=A0A813XPX2_9BILA|nr:unnamed protein product [Adineta steineri]CAF4086794.1 unnamed protein product [Adineta steineri]